MWRFYYVIARNLHILPTLIGTMRKKIEDVENYSEEENYNYVRYITQLMGKTGHIKTEVFGTENLPKEGGYMMYPNHQGKYDAYSIVCGHEKPATVVMDKDKSYGIFIREIIDSLRGKRMDINDPRQAMTIINEISKEVANGRRYILFPEGGYDDKKKNSLINFKAGSFKIALKSKVPVVPVVLIDSYKAFNSWHVGKVKTQVHFLEPIYYEEYREMKTKELAEFVKTRIQNKITEVTRE